MTEMTNGTATPQSALNELAGITLAGHSLDSVMDKIASLAKRTLAGADEVSVTLLEDGAPRTVAFTGQLALDLDERQYEHDHGPCLACIAGGEPMLITDMSNEARWPDWATKALEHGAHSSLSLPVPMQREMGAALNVYSTRLDAFDASAVELATSFAGFAAVALTNMHQYDMQAKLAAQLQEAMRSRAIIEQAKGILMGQRRCTSQEAFDLLVQLSQDSNRKLRGVAQALVDEATGVAGTAESPAP